MKIKLGKNFEPPQLPYLYHICHRRNATTVSCISGSLSAFFRETYPDLTIGAVSTSSAVNVFVDYYGTSPCSFLRSWEKHAGKKKSPNKCCASGYLQNAEENYRAQNVSCAASIATAFRSMQTNFYNGAGGRQLLKNIFRYT